MTIDPNDYDVNELRGVHAGDDGGGGPAAAGGRVRADEVLQSGQHRELFLLESAAPDGTLEKPYLDALPEAYAAETIVFEWLEFLLAKAGFKRTLDAFRYYRSIDWLTEDVEADLRDYAAGFDDAGGTETVELDRSDHTLSLVYIARLASMD